MKPIAFPTPPIPPVMEDGVFYDLDPPSVVQGQVFRRVLCEYRVPDHPDEYSVKGVPDGGTKEEPFLLRFTSQGRVRAVRSKDQRDQGQRP